jgi:hypothetical protein
VKYVDVNKNVKELVLAIQTIVKTKLNVHTHTSVKKG